MEDSDLLQATENLTGERGVGEMVRLAGLEEGVVGMRALLHHAILMANELGQEGNQLLVASAGEEERIEEVKSPRGKKERRGVESRVGDVEGGADKYSCVESEDLANLLAETVHATEKGHLNVDDVTDSNKKWDLLNSIFFAGTVISTIGYGNLAPRTTGGRIFCILYGIMGIPIFLLTITGVGSKLNAASVRLVRRNRYTQQHPKGVRTAKALVLFVGGSIVFLLIPAIMFCAIEDWTYGESVYYAFVTLSTIGFGDFISGMDPSVEYPGWYRLWRQVWLFLGLAWLSTMIGAKQDVIKTYLRPSVKRSVSEQHKAPWGPPTNDSLAKLKYMDTDLHVSDDDSLSPASQIYNDEDTFTKIKKEYLGKDSQTTKRHNFGSKDDYEKQRVAFYI